MHSHRFENLHVTLRYEFAGDEVEVSGPLSYLVWETDDSVYDQFYENGQLVNTTPKVTWTFEPARALETKIGYTNAVKGIRHTAEIEANGSTVEDFEHARKAVGAPTWALMEINTWSYPEAIRRDAGTPVRVVFSWEE